MGDLISREKVTQEIAEILADTLISISKMIAWHGSLIIMMGFYS